MGEEVLDQASESSIVPLVKASSKYQLILQACASNLDLLPQARACHVVWKLARLQRDCASFKAIAPIRLLTISVRNPSRLHVDRCDLSYPFSLSSETTMLVPQSQLAASERGSTPAKAGGSGKLGPDSLILRLHGLQSRVIVEGVRGKRRYAR